MRKLKKIYETESVSENMREQLILDYTSLVRFISHKIVLRLPASVEVDDLMSAGIIGLMDAINKFDACRDNRFKTYAEFRIRGAIIDELRSQDWIPRSIREKIKVIDKASTKLEQQMKRRVSDEELSQELGVAINEYHQMVNKIKKLNVLSIEEDSGGESFAANQYQEYDEQKKEPFRFLAKKYTKEVLSSLLESLPNRQRLVLSLYYYEELNLREIGSLLEVTESRVSQLHTRGLDNLKVYIQSYEKHKGEI
jgi:RNA polymerase sigma factor FliA